MNYSNKVIDFFIRHNLYDKKMFDYLQRHTNMLDYRVEENRPYIGLYTVVKDGVLKYFEISIPYDYNDITTMIDIHEIVHGIIAYKHLYKEYHVDKTCEILPFLYEKIYVYENPNEELEKYSNFIDSCIDENSEEKYRLAIHLRNKLLEKYNGDFDKMDRMSKVLSLKYSIFHK